MYEGGVGELFDIAEARLALQSRKADLVAECEANSKLQRRFDMINAQLRNSKPSSNEKSNDNEEELTESNNDENSFEYPEDSFFDSDLDNSGSNFKSESISEWASLLSEEENADEIVKKSNFNMDSGDIKKGTRSTKRQTKSSKNKRNKDSEEF